MSSSLNLALGMAGFRRHLLKAHGSIPDAQFSVVLDCKKQEKNL
jgi:predicted ester cyclase